MNLEESFPFGIALPGLAASRSQTRHSLLASCVQLVFALEWLDQATLREDV